MWVKIWNEISVRRSEIFLTKYVSFVVAQVIKSEILVHALKNLVDSKISQQRPLVVEIWFFYLRDMWHFNLIFFSVFSRRGWCETGKVRMTVKFNICDYLGPLRQFKVNRQSHVQIIFLNKTSKIGHPFVKQDFFSTGPPGFALLILKVQKVQAKFHTLN